MSIFSLTFESILAVLLVIAILYCWRLDQRLKALRSGKDGMIQAARELQVSVSHAEDAILSLRQSAEAAGRDLQSKIDEARAVSTMGREEATGLRRRTTI